MSKFVLVLCFGKASGMNFYDRRTTSLCSIELAFMSFLCMREIEAQQAGEEWESYRLARAEFLEHHVLRWVPAWLERMQERAAHPYFRGAARLAREAIAQDAVAVVRG